MATERKGERDQRDDYRRMKSVPGENTKNSSVKYGKPDEQRNGNKKRETGRTGKTTRALFPTIFTIISGSS